MKYQIISERRLRKDVKIKHPEEVYELVKRYAKAKQEQFILLTLNGSHHVISISIIGIGIVNRTIIHPREIFCKAISDMALSIIICHNHPSGEIIPSDEDKEVTRTIYKASKIIGIPLIDHIVFSKYGYISQRIEGDFPGRKLKKYASS
jgi:DNA repair protein RadC